MSFVNKNEELRYFLYLNQKFEITMLKKHFSCRALVVTITFYSLVFETTRMCLSSPIIRENSSVFVFFCFKKKDV